MLPSFFVLRIVVRLLQVSLSLPGGLVVSAGTWAGYKSPIIVLTFPLQLVEKVWQVEHYVIVSLCYKLDVVTAQACPEESRESLEGKPLVGFWIRYLEIRRS